MRFQMLEPWHVANVHYEASAEVDGHSLPWPIPPTVRCLDQEALDAMCFWMGEEAYHTIHFTKGLQLPNPRFPPDAPLRKIPPSEAEAEADAPSSTFPRRL
jgi:hypothetical protein